MKVIGYKLEYSFDKGKIADIKKRLEVVECCSVEIEPRREIPEGDNTKYKYCVNLSTYHPSTHYSINSNQRNRQGFCRGLTLEEAEKIVERAAASDVIDLRELGDFHINSTNRMQTVMVTNDYDDFDDEIIPLEVKIVNK